MKTPISDMLRKLLSTPEGRESFAASVQEYLERPLRRTPEPFLPKLLADPERRRQFNEGIAATYGKKP